MNGRFARLPIAHRLLLSSVAFGVPIAALVSFGYFEVQARLDATRAEKLGVRLSLPLCDLSEKIARLARVAGPAPSGARLEPAAREKAVTDVETAFGALRDPAVRDAASRLGLVDGDQTDLVEDLRATWRKVPAAWAEGDPGAVRRATLVLRDGIAVQLRKARDTSRLVLDPALDSYYLMDATFRALPAAEARIGAALESRAMAGAGTPTLAFHAAELARGEHPLVLEALATSLREDAHYFGPSPSLSANLPPLRDQYDAAVRAFVEAARGAAAGDEEAGAVASTGEAALSAAAELRRAGAVELDRLLDVRVAFHGRQRLLVLALTALALAISVRHVAFVLLGISRPLRSVADAAHLVAAGDVAGARRRAADVPAPKEADSNEISRLGGAVREMANGLTTLLLEVRSAGGQVRETAARIAATARELEATSSEQAASTTEVSATSREIHRRAEGLAGTIGEVGKVVRGASDLAADGRRGLDRMESSMGQLTAATASVSERLAAISGKAEGIGAIVTTIGRVAEQTNLLSFNAAIEAEKAGEAGKGFVVVAREIRRLADRTASAAVDIGEVVGSMRSVVSAGVMEMDRFVDQVRREGEEVRRIGGQLGTVIEQVEALTPRFAEVLGAAEAQAASAREIREAVSQLSSAATQTRDTLEEWSRVAQGLDGAARTLAAQVARFRLAEDGGVAPAAGG